MPTHTEELVRAARRLATLQTTRRKLRRELKRVELDLRHEKKTLRALMGELDARRSDVMPSRVFGDGVGVVADLGEKKPA